MDESQMTVLQRISLLEGAVAQARREISVVSLAFLAVNATGDSVHYADVRARLVALGIVIETAMEELELLYEEQGHAQESR
jgi:hypothetical protein